MTFENGFWFGLGFFTASLVFLVAVTLTGLVIAMIVWSILFSPESRVGNDKNDKGRILPWRETT